MTTRNRDNNFFKIVPPITAICTLYYTLKGMKKKPTNFIPEFVGFLVKTTKKRFALNLGQVEEGAVYWGTAGACLTSSDRRERIARPQAAPNKSTPYGVLLFGAADETRTRTLLPARDFKSLVSAIPPQRPFWDTLPPKL